MRMPQNALAAERAYAEAVARLNELQSNASITEAVRLSRGALNAQSLPEMRAFWARLGHKPDALDNLHIVHVAGSKGKGSTAAMVESMLRAIRVPSPGGGPARPLKTGLYTSPHLVQVRERIQIGGQSLSRGAFARLFDDMWQRLASSGAESQPLPTYFRFLTLMALHAFVEQHVQVAIVEVGVGGEYDATNFVERPRVCAVTRLGKDHEALLGSTLPEIAWHKAGIFKPGAVALSGRQSLASLVGILADRARERSVARFEEAPCLETLAEQGIVPRNLRLGLDGAFQRDNAALAIAAVRAWLDLENIVPLSQPLPEAAVQALGTTRWPGRAQRIRQYLSDEKILVDWFLDGAHTPDSVEQCARWFGDVLDRQSVSNIPAILVFSCSGGRNPAALLGPLAEPLHGFPFAAALFCTPELRVASQDCANRTVSPLQSREASAAAASAWNSLASNSASTQIVPTVTDAAEWVAEYAKTAPTKHVRVLVTGSLHLVGAFLQHLQSDRSAISSTSAQS